MSRTSEVLEFLREACRGYSVAPRAVYQPAVRPQWPLVANSERELELALSDRGNFVPLPKEPAALANVLEVSIVDFLLDRFAAEPGVVMRRGTERGYPDIELSGTRFDGEIFAVDVKVARRSASGKQTQSRITLYTGNTYFRHPHLHWPGTFRPFDDYASHIDVVVLYTFDEAALSRIRDVEVLVHESWSIASKQRSSTTREYLGAVQAINDLRSGKGEFKSAQEFYAFWRKHPFKVGRAVEQQLARLLQQRKDKVF